MCISFYSSNNFLIMDDNWLIARKYFKLKNNKLVSSYNIIPYEAYETTLYDGNNYLQIVNRDRLQPVYYSCLVLDCYRDNKILTVKTEQVLGYHASLLNTLLVESEVHKLCMIDNDTVWLPIVFGEDNIQMVSSEDIIVSSFYIPLSPKFYFNLAEKIRMSGQVVKDFWWPVVSEVMQALKLNKIENRNE